MKVCYLGDNGSVHNQKWIQALSLVDDMELHVIAFDRGVKFDRVIYHPLKKYLGNKLDYIVNVPRVKKMVTEIHPDILHAHYATSYGYMGSKTGFHPYIITGWGADIFDSTKNPVMKLVLKQSFANADAITVLSGIALQEMKKLSAKPVKLIPFGVNVQQFIPAIKKHDGKFRIGTIRTLNEKYGVEYLVRAFALLYLKFPHVYLEIIGDGLLRKFLEQLTIELNIADRVTFHGYINQTNEFEKYYRLLSGFDVFCIPSILDSETFGVAAVEASSCGIPVIASRIGGLTGVIEDGKTGILVTPKDHVQLAHAIETIIADRELQSNMGQAGRTRAVAKYNWEDSMTKMLNVYKSVLK